MNDETYINSPIEIENELIDYFSKNKKITIFDIGSCDGLDSIKYARLFPNSKIYAFEPLSKNVELINVNSKKYNVSNVNVISFALSDKIGKEKFYVSSGNPEELKSDEWDYGNKSSSLLPPDKANEVLDWLKFEDEISVDTITLNKFCSDEKIEIIDFIHMDVQGAELLVLKGAQNFISSIKMIWLEVENISLYKNQPLKQDVESFMITNGFTKIKDTVNHVAGDQLWVNLVFFPRKKLTHTIWKFYSALMRK